ncbi:MAG TPA: hypothetical protein VF389_11835 [Woeseiaceae bacterium]
MTRAEEIAAGLSDTQRQCLMRAKITAPLKNVTVGGKPFMPDYWSVEVPASHSSEAPKQLEDMGLWSLPIRIGDRSHTSAYRGEILPLGRAVRKIIEARNEQ